MGYSMSSRGSSGVLLSKDSNDKGVSISRTGVNNSLIDFKMLCFLSFPFSVSQKWTTAKKMFAVWLLSKFLIGTGHVCRGA
jgi:hypothetical protein